MKPEIKGFFHQWASNLWARRNYFLRQFLAILAVSVASRQLLEYGPRLYTATAHVIGPHLTQLIVGTIVTVMGFVAHWFKRKSQRWYGRVEVIFGIVSGFSIAFRIAVTKPWLPQGATLVGCAYVIARGLNNMNEARGKALAAT